MVTLMSGSRFRRILCPVDFSEPSRHALRAALAVASWYEAEVMVRYVFANSPSLELPFVALTTVERERLLRRMRDLAEPVPVGVKLGCAVEEAPDARASILQQANATGADLLVMGSHGRSGVARWFLGSVTESVMRRAACPVLVVPPRAPDEAGEGWFQAAHPRILCPVDRSAGSLKALEWALAMAQEREARLTVLGVIEMPPELREHLPPSGEMDIDRLHAAARAAELERLRSFIPDSVRTYCSVETVVEEGGAYRQILTQARERRSDLIVMGVQGRGAMDLFVFGSNTQHVVRAALCPVLIVREAVPSQAGAPS